MTEFKSIDRLPVDVREKVVDYSRRLLDIHADNIVSIVVYGSAAGVNFTPGVSDINLAVVFRTLDLAVFTKTLKLAAGGRKDRITAPLFLTADYIHNSLDVFPIEFNEIKDQNIVIFGEDVFAPMEIDAKHLRLLCEAQIKGKLLRIRQAYLESGGKPGIIRHILTDSLNALIPVFRQLLRLKGVSPAARKEELLKQLAAQFSLDASALVAIHQHRSHAASLSPSRLEQYLKDYLGQLEQLAGHIDRL